MRGTKTGVRSRRGDAAGKSRGNRSAHLVAARVRTSTRAMIQARFRELTIETARPAKPAARPGLGLHPAPMLVDPRLGVGFGLEHADPGRITAWDTYLDTERPVVERDDAI